MRGELGECPFDGQKHDKGHRPFNFAFPAFSAESLPVLSWLSVCPFFSSSFLFFASLLGSVEGLMCPEKAVLTPHLPTTLPPPVI